MFGDKVKMATIILAVGANVLIGKTLVKEMFPRVENFYTTLVSGLLSCTVLVYLDQSQFMNVVINRINEMVTVVGSYRRVADV